MQNPSDKTQICPDCENTLQINPGYITWCEKCNWNLKHEEEAKTENLFESFFLKLGRKHSKSLFNSLINSNPEKLKPRLTPSYILAFLISIFIHLTTIVFIVFSIYFLVFGWSNWFLFFLGIICSLIAWFTTPRIPPVPSNVLSKQDFPVLYEFVDSVAESLDTKSVDGIIINKDLNASYGNYGFNNKKILSIGLPLWTILAKEERIALISHELSHGTNGDSIRGILIWTAIKSLIEWYEILCPNRLFEPENGFLGLLIIPLNLFMLTLSYLVRIMLRVLITLLFITNQKAEYLADFVATKTCGTKAMLSSLEKIQFGTHRFYLLLEAFSLRNDKRDFFEMFHQDIVNLPTEEKNRIKRLGQIEKVRLDSTHPPTFFAMKFLKKHFQKGIEFPITDKQMQNIDNELSILKKPIQNQLIDMHRDHLYL